MIDALVKGVSVTYKCYEIIVINVSFPLNNTNVMFWHHCNNLYIFCYPDCDIAVCQLILQEYKPQCQGVGYR